MKFFFAKKSSLDLRTHLNQNSFTHIHAKHIHTQEQKKIIQIWNIFYQKNGSVTSY